MLEVNKVYLMDVLKGLKQLDSDIADVIIVDPPYNIGKDFGLCKDDLALKDYVEWSKQWISECTRIMKLSGTMFIYGFSEVLAYLFVEIPINKRWLVWHYTNKNVPSLNFWQRSHESIICCWKGRPIFNRDAIREPYTKTFLEGAAGKVRAGTRGRFSKEGKETIYQAHEKGALPRDVIKVPTLAGGAGMSERWFFCKTCNLVCPPQTLKMHEKHKVLKHPTQKPLLLTKRLLLSAKPEYDGLLVVPFVGTGSECVAAKGLGMKYVGFEINPDYVKIAETWLATIKAPKLSTL